MDPLEIGAIGAGVGMLGSMFTSSPEWKGVDANQYGFQGVYQKFLQSENQRMKDDEQKRIMKLASNLVPGQSSFRSGLAAQGLNGSMSNVIGQQQREQGMGKALDTGLSTAEQGFGSLDKILAGQTSENEQMFNQASEFNAQGQFAADTAQSNKWQNMFGQVANAGMGMVGQQLGMQNYKDMFGGDKGESSFNLNTTGFDPAEYLKKVQQDRLSTGSLSNNSSYGFAGMKRQYQFGGGH